MTGVSNILGVILAGGASRRMFPDQVGGGDKGLADLGGQPMLASVIGRLKPQVDRLILSANGDPARFAAFELPVVADTEFAGSGPMAGILAAMTYATAHDKTSRAVITVTSDVPFLPDDLVGRLVACENGGRPVIAVSGGRLHPAIGLWPVTLAAPLRAALAGEARGLGNFARLHDAIEVAFPFGESGGVTFDPFFNANTPDDMREARALLARL